MLWVIKLSEYVFHVDLYQLGLYPREIKGLTGVVFAPLLHADFNHLFSNSIPLLVLGAGLFYFYREIGYKVFFSIYVMTGLWVWVSARPVYHIGASGVVYGLASFLFFSGLIRRHSYLMAFSLFVVFLYGSMIWGMIPLKNGVSWESHLMGAAAGLVCASYYRNIGLQKPKFDWEDLPDDENNEAIEEINEDNISPSNTTQSISYHYVFKEKDENKLKE